MKRLLIRCISLLLISSLVTDPALAAVSSYTFRISGWTPTQNLKLETRNPQFAEQAMAVRALSIADKSRFRPVILSFWRLFEAQESLPSGNRSQPQGPGTGVASKQPWGIRYQHLRLAEQHELADKMAIDILPEKETYHYFALPLLDAIERFLEELNSNPLAGAKAVVEHLVDGMMVDHDWLHVGRSALPMGPDDQQYDLVRAQLRAAILGWAAPLEELLAGHFQGNPTAPLLGQQLDSVLRRITDAHSEHNREVLNGLRPGEALGINSSLTHSSQDPLELKTQLVGREILRDRPPEKEENALKDRVIGWGAIPMIGSALLKLVRQFQFVRRTTRVLIILSIIFALSPGTGMAGAIGAGATAIGVQSIWSGFKNITSWVATRFIAGKTIEETIPKLKALQKDGIQYTLDCVGEKAHTAAEANWNQDHIIDTLSKLAQDREGQPRSGWADAAPIHMSVKLSALSDQFYSTSMPREAIKEDIKKRLRKIVAAANKYDAAIWIDMEEYSVHDLTVEVYEELIAEPKFTQQSRRLGIVLQAYLKDSEKTAARLVSLAEARAADHLGPVCVRLVKGAYWDQEVKRAQDAGEPIPVWHHDDPTLSKNKKENKWENERWSKAETDAAYERIAAMLVPQHSIMRLAFATHNVRTMARVLALTENIPKDQFELQMLYGMGESYQRELAQMGYRVRAYVPFGSLLEGLKYLARRLIENTSQQGMLRASLRVDVNDEAAIRKLLESPHEIVSQYEERTRPKPPPEPAMLLPMDTTYVEKGESDIFNSVRELISQWNFSQTEKELESIHPPDNSPAAIERFLLLGQVHLFQFKNVVAENDLRIGKEQLLQLISVHLEDPELIDQLNDLNLEITISLAESLAYLHRFAQASSLMAEIRSEVLKRNNLRFSVQAAHVFHRLDELSTASLVLSEDGSVLREEFLNSIDARLRFANIKDDQNDYAAALNALSVNGGNTFDPDLLEYSNARFAFADIKDHAGWPADAVRTMNDPETGTLDKRFQKNDFRVFKYASFLAHKGEIDEAIHWLSYQKNGFIYLHSRFSRLPHAGILLARLLGEKGLRRDAIYVMERVLIKNPNDMRGRQLLQQLNSQKQLPTRSQPGQRPQHLIPDSAEGLLYQSIPSVGFWNAIKAWWVAVIYGTYTQTRDMFAKPAEALWADYLMRLDRIRSGKSISVQRAPFPTIANFTYHYAEEFADRHVGPAGFFLGRNRLPQSQLVRVLRPRLRRQFSSAGRYYAKSFQKVLERSEKMLASSRDKKSTVQLSPYRMKWAFLSSWVRHALHNQWAYMSGVGTLHMVPANKLSTAA